jgi:hypothetical protein
MRKISNLSQYFLICAALLISSKSFAEVCPSGGITTSITCAGDISTAGTNLYAISLNSNNIVNMTGNITTSGLYSYGIYLAPAVTSGTVNMIGNITTDNTLSFGIYLVNDTSTTTNNIKTVNMTGNIATRGNGGFGISIFNNVGTNNTNIINITGNISTTGGVDVGRAAYGIFLYNYTGTNNTNTVNMAGDILTTGANALGIYLNNSSTNNSTNTVNIIGNISTTGADADGIHLINNSAATNTNINTNTINMTGNISATGVGADGIQLYNSGASNSANTVNISGRISATGADSYAIKTSNNSATSSNTVQLNKGSSVIGGILGEGLYSANNFLKLNLGAGASYSFATEGAGTINDLNSRPVVGSSSAGVGNVSTASQSLYERTSQITQSLDDRVRTYDLKQQPSQDFWINTYYSDSSRGGQGLSGSNLSFNQYRSGITAGFNVKNSYTPTELIVNYEHGKLNIDEGNQGITSNSVMAGGLFPDIKKLFTGTLSAKALVGYSDFSGDRKVLTNDVAFNGSRNVTANYQSSHLTIGSAWTKTLYQTDKIILDTLVGIDLNTQHINSYSESDLFKWNGRTINQLQERVTLGMEIKPMVKPLTLFGRVGVERRDLISGENQNYAINNTAVSYNDSNQRNTYATLNAGAYYPLTPTVKAYAQVRYYDSTKDIDSLSGSIGISGQF